MGIINKINNVSVGNISKISGIPLSNVFSFMGQMASLSDPPGRISQHIRTHIPPNYKVVTQSIEPVDLNQSVIVFDSDFYGQFSSKNPIKYPFVSRHFLMAYFKSDTEVVIEHYKPDSYTLSASFTVIDFSNVGINAVSGGIVNQVVTASFAMSGSTVYSGSIPLNSLTPSIDTGSSIIIPAGSWLEIESAAFRYPPLRMYRYNFYNGNIVAVREDGIDTYVSRCRCQIVEFKSSVIESINKYDCRFQQAYTSSISTTPVANANNVAIFSYGCSFNGNGFLPYYGVGRFTYDPSQDKIFLYQTYNGYAENPTFGVWVVEFKDNVIKKQEMGTFIKSGSGTSIKLNSVYNLSRSLAKVHGGCETSIVTVDIPSNLFGVSYLDSDSSFRMESLGTNTTYKMIYPYQVIEFM